MSGAILHKSHERFRFPEMMQYRLDDRQIRLRCSCRHIVNSSRLGLLEGQDNGPAVILDVEPIPFLHSIAINGSDLFSWALAIMRGINFSGN